MVFRYIKETIKTDQMIFKSIMTLRYGYRYYGLIPIIDSVNHNSLDIKGKIKYYKSLVEELEIQFNRRFKMYTHNKDNRNTWFIEDMLADISKRKEIAVNKLDTYRKIKSGKIKQNDFNLELLKQVPLNQITEILPDGFFRNNPFRTERSPSNSLYWNKRSNRWTDFGTGDYGDVIDLYQAMNRVTFVQACKELSNYI